MMSTKDNKEKRMLTTNNRQELMGILMGLRLLEAGHNVRIRSDSEWALRSISGQYRASANIDLLDQIKAEIKRLGSARCKFLHVKGHAGDPYNELTDRLAGTGLAALEVVENGKWMGKSVSVVGISPIAKFGGAEYLYRADSHMFATYHHTIRYSFH